MMMGKKIGVVIKISAAISIIIPSNRNVQFSNSKIMNLDSEKDSTKPASRSGTRLRVRRYAKAEAQAISTIAMFLDRKFRGSPRLVIYIPSKRNFSPFMNIQYLVWQYGSIVWRSSGAT